MVAYIALFAAIVIIAGLIGKIGILTRELRNEKSNIETLGKKLNTEKDIIREHWRGEEAYWEQN